MEKGYLYQDHSIFLAHQGSMQIKVFQYHISLIHILVRCVLYSNSSTLCILMSTCNLVFHYSFVLFHFSKQTQLLSFFLIDYKDSQHQQKKQRFPDKSQNTFEPFYQNQHLPFEDRVFQVHIAQCFYLIVVHFYKVVLEHNHNTTNSIFNMYFHQNLPLQCIFCFDTIECTLILKFPTDHILSFHNSMAFAYTSLSKSKSQRECFKFSSKYYYQSDIVQNLNRSLVIFKMIKYTSKNLPNTSLMENLQQYKLNLKAFNFQLHFTYQKVFQGFKMIQEINNEEEKMKLILRKWMQISKINKVKRKRKELCLRYLKNRKLRKQKFKLMDEKSQCFYENQLKSKYFTFIKIHSEINKKQKQLTNIIISNALIEFKEIINCQKMQKQQKSAVQTVYESNLIKKIFQAMKTSSLISKLQKNQLKKDFPLFISLMKKDISSSNVKADSFRESYLKKTAFSKLRVYKLFIKAEQYHEKTLLRKGFISWVQNIYYMFYMRERQEKMQESANSMLQRKNIIQMQKIFLYWKKWTNNKRQQKKNKLIMKQYVQIKQKECLLQKYFENFKKFVKINKSLKFHKRKLKQKTFESFKVYIIQQALQWQKVMSFVQKRQQYKYFQAIKQFNEQEKEKVKQFRLKTSFRKFSLNIVQQYVDFNQKSLEISKKQALRRFLNNSNKARNYHQNSALSILYFNIVIPLRRWRKSVRVRNFVKERQAIIKAKILMQLKILLMKKNISPITLERSRVDKVYFDSVNLVSLDFSISESHFQV